MSKIDLKNPANHLIFSNLFKGVRSFNTISIGSVGQRASKLLAVKVGGQKKVCCFGHSSRFVCKRIQPGFESAHGRIIFKV